MATFVALINAAHCRSVEAQPRDCGDLNASGAITASDALMVLQRAVGQDVTLQCPACGPSTTTTIGGPTTTTVGPTTTVGSPTTTVGGPTTTTTIGTCSFPGGNCSANADCCQNQGDTLCCDNSCLFVQACKQTGVPCFCDAQCCSGICGSDFPGLCD